MAGSRADVFEFVPELVADVDQQLQLTYATLIVARCRFRRCPSAAQGRACQIVEAQLDELLDLRLALSCPRGPALRRGRGLRRRSGGRAAAAGPAGPERSPALGGCPSGAWSSCTSGSPRRSAAGS
jgi:hypothetical protein